MKDAPEFNVQPLVSAAGVDGAVVGGVDQTPCVCLLGLAEYPLGVAVPTTWPWRITSSRWLIARTTLRSWLMNR